MLYHNIVIIFENLISFLKYLIINTKNDPVNGPKPKFLKIRILN